MAIVSLFVVLCTFFALKFAKNANLEINILKNANIGGNCLVEQNKKLTFTTKLGWYS